MMKTYAKFQLIRGKYVLLRKLNNVLVHLHTRTTPRSAVPDTLTEVIQEQLRAVIRKNEFRAYSLQQQYEALGKEILR